MRAGSSAGPRICKEPGCPKFRPCPQHPEPADTRPSAAARGYDHKWRRTRGRFLKLYPVCQWPAGCAEQATDVHHVDLQGPHGPLGHAHKNLQALCKSHHSQITGSTT